MFNKVLLPGISEPEMARCVEDRIRNPPIGKAIFS